jgi:hypothetical protein
MRLVVILVLSTSLLSGWNVTAQEKSDRLSKDWPGLQGSWVTAFVPSGDGTADRRSRLDLRKSGGKLLFEHYEEVKMGREPIQKCHLHSAVIVVKAVRVKDGKPHLVVGPSGQPEFDKEIRYELIDEKLHLEGALGTAKLTGTWSRLDENK